VAATRLVGDAADSSHWTVAQGMPTAAEQ